MTSLRRRCPPPGHEIVWPCRLATPPFLHHDGDVADQQGAGSPRKPRKSLTPPAPTARARKAATTKKAMPTKKAATTRRAAATKRVAASKTTAAAKTAPKKATATKRAAATKAAAPKKAATKKAAPTKKAAATKKAAPTKKAAARKAVKARSAVTGATGAKKPRAPRASARARSSDLVAGVSTDLTEVVAPPDAPITEDGASPAPDDATTSAAPTPPPAPPSPPDRASRNGVAKGALVLSLLALATCWISVFTLVLAPIILLGVLAVIVAIRARRADLRLATVALLIGALALVAGIGTAAAAALNGDSGGVKYSSLVPGDCLEKPGDAFETAQRVDCAKPHDLEVFALVDDPAPKGAKYPGRDLMDREANVACPPQFQSYVGVPFDESQLGVTFFVPVKATWEANSRRLLCTVSAKTGKLTGSVKGTKR